MHFDKIAVGAGGKVGYFYFAPSQKLLTVLLGELAKLVYETTREEDMYFCFVVALPSSCSRLLSHTSRSPSSVSYKTIVSTLLTHVRGSSICFLSCRYHKADRGKKTDFSVCKGRYFAILPEVLRKHRMGRKGSGQYKRKDV